MSGCVRLLSENYIDLEILANSDVSSERAAFPVTNAYNKQRRSKVWRSNGYFNVESGSNTIVFKDASGGANKTATIAAGEYSSTSAFMTAVDTAFEAAGVANYTVTQDSNLKFVITSDLSGGATHFELIWTHADSAAMAGIMGFDTSVDQTGASSYTADLLRIHTSEWILWDLGISSDPDSFALIGPRNSAIKISPSATLKLQANETDNWSSPSFETTLTYDDEVIAKLSDSSIAGDAYRYWRLYFEDKDNPNGYIEVGAFFLGQYYAPNRGRVQFPFVSQAEDRSTTVTSEGGQTFHDIKQQTRTYNIQWKGLKKDEMEEIQSIFANYGISKPLFISFDSSAAFSSSALRKLKYVKFVDEPKEELVSPNNYSCSMQFREEL